MFNIFGKKKPEKVVVQVDLGETSNRIGNNINDVKLKLETTEKELKAALEVFRNARTTQQKSQAKMKATNLLKKKKMYEAHLSSLGATQFNVESAHIQTQMMRDNIDIMGTLKQTVNMQKDMMGTMNPDAVLDLMDDMKDIQDDQAEINEAFTRNYEIDVGDEELDAGIIYYLFILELDELDYQMKIELDAKDLTVPNKRIISQKEHDEKELEHMLR